MLWFTSDLHFDHRNIITYCNRPFSSVEEMNEVLVQRWNSVVSESDHVYCLGDFSLSRRSVQAFTLRLNGIKTLVAGNHDHCHPVVAKKKVDDAIKYYIDSGWSSVIFQGELSIGGVRVQLSHFPETGDTSYGGDRFNDFRLTADAPLLHGHVHNNWKKRVAKSGVVMLNVGVDVWDYYPISEETVLAEISTLT